MLNETPRAVTVAEQQEITRLFNAVGYRLSADMYVLENARGQKVPVKIKAGCLNDGITTVANAVYIQSLPNVEGITILKAEGDASIQAVTAAQLKLKLDQSFTN